LYRIFGLLSCGGLVVATFWLANGSRAQDNPFGPRPAPARTSLFNDMAAPPQTASNPFAEPAATPRPQPAPQSATSQEAVKKRVDDTLQNARQALARGDTESALLFASSADRMARQMNLTFREGEQSPAQLIAQIEGRSPSGAWTAESRPVCGRYFRSDDDQCPPHAAHGGPAAGPAPHAAREPRAGGRPLRRGPQLCAAGQPCPGHV
jgi:hypothetical protein